VGRTGRGGLFSRVIGGAEGGCGRTLGCVRVIGRHSVRRDENVEVVEGKVIGGTKSVLIVMLRGRR
jgi:hypothetical protein